MKNLSALLLALLLNFASLSLAQPGTVISHQKISDLAGNLTATLNDQDAFGVASAGLGDLDGDGVPDLAVGAGGDDDGGTDRGAIYVLFMNADGTVKSHQKISATEGGFTGVLSDDAFGRSVTALGDLDGNGINDLAVGAPLDDDGGTNRGAVWILFLKSDGTVLAQQKISATQGDFTGALTDQNSFGTAVASLDDLDNDGVAELAVGANGDNDGGYYHGAVWILFLNMDGTVKSHQKISDTQGGFAGVLLDADQFGFSIFGIGDLDNDNVIDLAVGAVGDDSGADAQGAVWILFLNADGTVKGHQKINETEGGFSGELTDVDFFGHAVAGVGDLDGDAVPEVAVGAIGDDDGGSERGAVWILFLNTNGTVKSHQKISATEGGFTGTLNDGDSFGDVSVVGDLNDDGFSDLAVGAFADDDGGTNRGAVWVLFLDGIKPFVFLANQVTLKRTKQATPGGDIHSNGALTIEKGDPSTYNSNLFAVGKITINKQNTVNGDVKSQTNISNSGTITGATSIAPVESVSLPSLSFSAGGPSKTVPSNGALTLVPGSYGVVTMSNNGTLKLTSGEYFMAELRYSSTIKAGVIEIDLASGDPVTINVVSNLQFGHEAAIRLLPNGESDSKLVTFSTRQTTNAAWGREAYLLGSFNAPNAVVTLVKNTQLRGAICANRIIVERDCLFLHHYSPGSLSKNVEEEVNSNQLPVSSYQLEQNYPNPFNPSTTIRFSLPHASLITLKVFNLSGQEVATLLDEQREAGMHTVRWNANGLPSGVYFYRLQVGEFEETRKLVLMR